MRRSVSCGRRNPPPASAAIAPAPNNRKSRRVRWRRTRGSISITGRGRSSKRPCRFSTETDSTATDGAVSLVLDSRSTQSIFALFFIRGELRPLRSCCPTYDHAAQRIPPVGKNQNHMWHNEEDVDPQEPEMPDTRCVIPSENRSQPMELHGLVNRPARNDRKARGDWNREVCCALERFVLCVETGMQPF